MEVSSNGDTPKSSILIGFHTINYPFWGTLIYGNPHMYQKTVDMQPQYEQKGNTQTKCGMNDFECETLARYRVVTTRHPSTYINLKNSTRRPLPIIANPRHAEDNIFVEIL
jgi:hypothetical protein